VDRPILPFVEPSPLDPPSVLLIDSSTEDREVLRFALQRRGMRIFEADEAEAGLRLAQEHHPNVIVLDLETDAADREDLRAQFDAASAEDRSSLVILGRARRYNGLPKNQVLAKPYHFGPLVRTIEQLAAKAA
jgi:CheY-like chemotaxis protein